MEGAFTSPDWLFSNLLKQESGNRDILGPVITAGDNKGDRAFGPAQIMPKTAADPGYGVKPFDPNAADPVEENRRFGREYLDAMLKEFGGDKEASLIAYNAGPGNAQKWLAADRDYSVLPQRGQTEPYVRNILGMKGKDMPQPTQGAFTSSAAPQTQPSWMQAFDASEESKSPLGQLLRERIGDAKSKMAATGSKDGFEDKLKAALYEAGMAMVKSKDPNPWNSIGQGLGGAATGLNKLEQQGKKTQEATRGNLSKLELAAAKLATPKKGKDGKPIRFKDLMTLVKEENAGIVDPAALRKAAVQYGYQIKDDPFGSAYLQQAVKDLSAKAKAGEISEDEKAELEALVDLFKDVK